MDSGNHQAATGALSGHVVNVSLLPMSVSVFYGAVINPLSLRNFDALPRCLLAVSSSGIIEWIIQDVADAMVQQVMADKGCFDAEVIVLKTGQFIMPGFVDTHTHAPQIPNLGRGQQYELLDWLTHVTFPAESQYADVKFARRIYEAVVRRTIDCGTTTCCYYGSLHLESTKVLADIVHENGQRAFVGKCNMNRNSPETYVQPSVEASIEATKNLIKHIRGLPTATTSQEISLVKPILTPRFAISCTDELLSSLGTLAASNPQLHIQTHLSENLSEIAFTKSLFPKCSSYTDVYDSFGLLRNNTVLAHAIHLEPEEMKLIKERQAGISHCPTSNFNLSSGVAPVGEYLDRGIKVGLGTDISGGFEPSILGVIRHASIAAKILAMQSTDGESSPLLFANRQLSVATLLYLATMGGAEVCCLDTQIGTFAPGKSFDALVVNVRHNAGNPSIWGVDLDLGLGVGVIEPGEALRDSLEKFLFCGDDRNISSVYVQGRLVGGTSRG